MWMTFALQWVNIEWVNNLMTGYKYDWVPCVLLLSMVLSALYELDTLGIGFLGEDLYFVYILHVKFERAFKNAARFGITLINNPHEGRVIVIIVTSSNATNTST